MTTTIENSLAEQILANNFGPDLAKGVEQITAFAALFTQKAVGQLQHDLISNAPKGYVTREDAISAKHAIERGVASAINAKHHWACNDAVRYAYAILEDANCHTEAKALLESAKRNGIELDA